MEVNSFQIICNEWRFYQQNGHKMLQSYLILFLKIIARLGLNLLQVIF